MTTPQTPAPASPPASKTASAPASLATSLLTSWLGAERLAALRKGWAKIRRWLRPPRQIRFTSEGKWFFWLTLGVGIAAVNTGNNLLYLILGMLISLIIVSGILSNIALNDLEIKRLLPERIYARTPCLVTLSITNKKKRFSSFSLEIEDRMIPAIDGADLPLGKGKKCFFLKVGPGREQKAAYRLTCPRRGRYRFLEMKISTRFPFSLFVKSKVLSLDTELIALPALASNPIQPPRMPHARGMFSSPQAGIGTDFFALREMQPGDEMRRIHWPTSVRSGRFQIREFEYEGRPRFSIFFWNAPAPGVSFCSEDLDPSVEIAASMIAHLVRQGHLVSFSSASSPLRTVETPHHLTALLYHLALLEPVPQSQALSPPHPRPLLVIHPDVLPPPSIAGAVTTLPVAPASSAPAPSGPSSSSASLSTLRAA